MRISVALVIASTVLVSFGAARVAAVSTPANVSSSREMPLRVGTWLDILTAQDAAGTLGGPRCQSTAS